MTKSGLVKIGLPSEQAQGMKRLRSIRQVLDQRDAAVARLNAATEEKIRELLATDGGAGEGESEPVAAAG